MGNIIIFIFAYVCFLGLGWVRAVLRENDEHGLSDSVMAVELILILLMVPTFIFSSIFATDSFGLLGFAVVVSNIIVGVVTWYMVPIREYFKSKNEPKIEIKNLNKKLYKNYSKQHADLVLKFYKLMIDGKYAQKLSDKHFQLHIPYYLENRSFSYWEDESHDRINIITRLIEFVNINILYSDNKDYAEATEAILLEKENAKRIVFILNVLEDKEKMEFLSTEEGETQLKIICKDLQNLNYNIKENVEKIVEITKKTKANKMNEDFNLLRKNSFDEIEEMRRD